MQMLTMIFLSRRQGSNNYAFDILRAWICRHQDCLGVRVDSESSRDKQLNGGLFLSRSPRNHTGATAHMTGPPRTTLGWRAALENVPSPQGGL